MFDKFKEIRHSLQSLEKTLQLLLVQTQGAVAQDIKPRMPGEEGSSSGFTWRDDFNKPKEPEPAKPPPRRPREVGGFNDPRGFQGPPPRGAKALPPPAQTEDPRRVVVKFIEDMRAAAVHFHNCSRLLLSIADLVDFKLNDRRPRPDPHNTPGGFR
jgi:hypothetical protein